MTDRRRLLTHVLPALLTISALPGLRSAHAGQKKVLVIGAGIAGLAAARQLRQHGLQVRVLEAKSTAGGRIHGRQVDGDHYELGASWIHGGDNNPVAEILRKQGAQLHATPFDEILHYRAGKKLDLDKEILQQFQAFLEGVKRGKKDMSIHDAWQSFRHKNSARLRPEQWHNLWHFLAIDIQTEIGADLRHISAMQYEEEGEMKGGDLLVSGGYQTVIKHLAEGLEIELNSPVKKIEHGAGGVTVHADDGRRWQADALLLTVPLGVLQKGSLQFEPPLTAAKQQAIKRLGMGNLHKIFLRFKQPFWDEADSIMVINGKNTEWGNFINLQPVLQQPLLLALHAGADALKMQGKTTAQLGTEALAVLQQIYPQATAPQTVVRSEWHADPYTLGSYSYMPTGTNFALYKDIAKAQGNLYFAGEHTHERYPATTHGAYLSGLRAAREIISGTGKN